MVGITLCGYPQPGITLRGYPALKGVRLGVGVGVIRPAPKFMYLD